MTNLINLTPHVLNVLKSDGSTHVIEPSGKTARVSAKQIVADTVDGIEIFRQEFGEVVDLPEPQEGILFVVSRMVKDRVPNRNDVLVPGVAVRDEQGRIIGANGLSL